ncbi:MAG: lyase family protein [Flavihumibacter sp.]|nr:lyase family protein [Flavihumibacter sp.]
MNYQSTIFSAYLSDPEIATLISDEALIKKMLQFEAALATAQAKLGMIPQTAADEIKTVLNAITILPADLSAGTLQNGIPVVTLVALVKQQLSKEAQPYFHFGTTSQDVMDTAMVLLVKDALAVINNRTTGLIQALQHLSQQYGATPCMARTRAQLAMPVTFAHKINAWLQPLQNQAAGIQQLKKNMALQLGGAAGDAAAFGNNATALVNEVATILNITAAPAWHAQRSSVASLGNWLALHTAILAKMGADILVMAQSEINEVEENAGGGGKSSAMPHKNNPVLSEAMVALGKINAGLQSQLLLAVIHQNERDAAAWILEWNALPQLLINTAIALQHATTIATAIKVNTAQMLANVETFNKANK